MNPALRKRLEDCLPQIRQYQEICKAPSITFGVVSNGQVIFKQSLGHRDAGEMHAANSDTMYMIGSCAKMFTSAAVGILVDEGKLHWTDPIQKHIPEFDPEGDPRVGKEADIIDCLRHSTGLSPPTMLVLGPTGTIISNEDDLVPLLNIMPTSDEQGQKFNREWSYNNFLVGLVALVVQRVSGKRFADFVRERILDPLKMDRTAVKQSDMKNDDNIADSCVKLTNGRFFAVDEKAWPCEDYTPLLAATGMRSTLDDMLTWCIAVLDAELAENNHEYQLKVPNNPLRQMSRARRGYWTRPSDDPDLSQDTTYGMGWFCSRLPSSMLGSFSGNTCTRQKEHGMLHLKHILGKDAEPFQMIGHTGGMRGSIVSVFTFPATQSAVVTMTNSRDFGDLSDWTAQLLIQALFDLKPVVNLTSCVMKEAELAGNHYWRKIEQPWEENRRAQSPKRDPLLYAGEYLGFRGLFTLSIFVRSSDSREPKLAVIFNNDEASECPLIFYKTDTYSFLQSGKDNEKIQHIFAVDYKQTLLEFQFDGEDSIVGLWWLWDSNAERAWLEKVT
ncbi:beta-lactamase/transpeptidase-like protein [Aspergillus granulosus]|uniref:Beta-lactamase/transpeptidase-like protein n=1 Tax=Aspergillus granulosus TaxID=176169 RepID=A0ABR4GZG9_9EURO